MEKQKLPNVTLIFLLGFFSIITCWAMGIVGLIFGIVALSLSNKSFLLVKANPEKYSNVGTLLIGRTFAIIGIFLSTFYLLFILFVYTVIGMENVDEWQKSLLNRVEYEQQN